MEFQLSYFKSWKMLWKCCTQYASKSGKYSRGHRTEKGVFIPIPKKGNAKECSNYPTISLISQASKVTLKILQARLQQLVNHELQMFKLVLEKADEPEIKLPTSIGSSKKRVPEKHLFLLYWLHESLWLCGSQQTVENSKRDGNTRTPDLPLEKPICRSGSKLKLDTEQQTGSK